ncbi:MAG TPA: hypothetical protein VG965_00565 [Patescibacteria group bacterium]|nr:hypothetical protein [Patescibacteria group bacterium]
MVRKVLIIFLSAVLYLNSFIFVYAQDTNDQSVQGAATLGVAHMVNVKAKNIKDGSIVSSSSNESVLTNVPYDSQVLGVVARDAAIILNTTNDPNSVPVISTGTVYVLVMTSAGKIKKGDLITSSTNPGVGIKATDAGYVLGTAMEDDDNPNTKQVDKIAVSLDLHYFNSKPKFPGSLSDIFKFALLPTKEGPSALFKYVVAATVVLGSLVLGFMSFGRTAAKGIEALGRNPAASRIIHLGIIFNVAIVISIALAGLGVAFLILRL